VADVGDAGRIVGDIFQERRNIEAVVNAADVQCIGQRRYVTDRVEVLDAPGDPVDAVEGIRGEDVIGRLEPTASGALIRVILQQLP